MRALRLAVAVVVLAVIEMTGGPALAAQDDSVPQGTRWAVQPSSEDGPTGRDYFVYELAPGSSLEDYVGITNLGDEPLTYTVYSTDAYTTADGAFALLPASQEPTDVGSWISFGESSYTIEPGQRRDIPFRLQVPSGATPGDHAGGVIASILTQETGVDGEVVNVDRRVAARVYLRVDGVLQPSLHVESMAASYDDGLAMGSLTLTYTVRNTGNVRLAGAAHARVTGPFGWELASGAARQLPELLPGSAFTVTDEVSGLPSIGLLRAELTIDPLTAAGEPLPPVKRSVSVWAPPWLLLVAILLVGWVAFVLRVRRRRAARPSPTDSSATDARTQAATEPARR